MHSKVLFIESVLNVFHTLTIFCCCQTQNGVSPVYVASQNGHTEVVDLLVQAGADIHLATTDEVHVSTHTVSSSVAAVVGTDHTHKRGNIVNPRRACVCVCVFVKSNFTLQISNQAINEHAYLVAYEGQKICGDLPETTGLKSYAMKHK